MFTLRKLCFRCIDTEELEAEARISDMTASANVSRLPFDSKYAGLPEQGAGPELPRLVLTIQETVEMDPAKVFELEPLGLRGSSRFGSGSVTAGSADSNDICLPVLERGIGSQHFQIDFSPRKQTYSIRDLGEGTGTFIRLDIPHYVVYPCIVSFGDSHMKVALQDELRLPCVEIVFIEGPKKDELFKFRPEQSPVRIGRQSGSAVLIEDSSLSRCQCSLEFDEDKGWSVRDGDGVKSSTNGTWLYAEDPCELHSGTIFKAGQTLFKATLELHETAKDCD